MTCRLTLPLTFWNDHAERCSDHPGIRHEIKVGKRTVIVELDAEALADLKSDADYYSDARGFDEGYDHLHRSARATLKALERQCAS